MTTHLAVPFRFDSGVVATVEQDSPDDVAQSVRVLVTTERGSRIEVPGYGLHSPLGQQSTSPITNEILGAVTQWEPRAQVDVTSQIDSIDEFVRDIRIRVRSSSVV